MFADESFFIWATELKWCSAGAARVYCGGGLVAFSMPELPRVWDANAAHLLAEEDGGVSAPALADIEARVMPVYAASGCLKRSFNLPYDELCPALCAEFETAGYSREVSLGMRRDGLPPASSPLPPGLRIVEAAREPGINAAFLRERLASPEAKLSAEEILELERIKNPVLGTRWFLALAGGGPVARLGLFAADGTGRFQDVTTLSSQRGKGIATALAAHAMRVFAAEHGCERFALLVSDSGPVTLYERWGFTKAGSVTCYRKDHPAPPGA